MYVVFVYVRACVCYVYVGACLSVIVCVAFFLSCNMAVGERWPGCATFFSFQLMMLGYGPPNGHARCLLNFLVNCPWVCLSYSYDDNQNILKLNCKCHT